MKNTSSQKVSKRRLRMALMCLVFFIQVAPCWIMVGCAKNYDRIEQEQTKEEAKRKAEATKIQGVGREFLVRNKVKHEKAAATKLQAVTGGLLARKDCVEKKEAAKRVAEQAAATKIQAAARRCNAEKQLTTEKNAATTLQAATRGLLARKDCVEKKVAATKIQAAIRKYNAEKKQLTTEKETATKLQAAVRGRQARTRAEKQAAATKIQAAVREKQARIRAENTLGELSIILEGKAGESTPAPETISAKRSNSETSVASFSNDDEDSWSALEDSTFHNRTSEPYNRSRAHVDLKKQLDSSTIRHVIIKQLPGFQESKNTFETGGVQRHTFFYKADSHSGEKTYISFANHREPDNSYGVCGGEQSISTVLQAIKKDLEGNSNNSETKILIPLQQVGKKHWTLLAITLPKNGSKNNGYTAEAIHYDSKGWLNKLRDLKSEGKKYVDAQVKKYFLAKEKEVDYQYLGTQGPFDHHNCGRHALIKLLALIDPEETPRTVHDINHMINAE